MDNLKELSIQLGGKIRTQELYNYNFKDTSFRELVVKDYRGFKILIDEFGSLLEIKIDIESDYVLAINNPEKISSINQEIIFQDFNYKVFSNESLSNPLSDNEFKAFWNIFSLKITELNLYENESVFITGYNVSLVLNSQRNLIISINDSIDIINSHLSIFYKTKIERIFKKNIPENLRPLIPLLKKWTIPDDSEREQLMEETTEKQKKKIVNKVYPYMTEINEFLNSFGDNPLSHEAILIGNLAELVSEIQITMD
jgi:hypothetical protein